MYDLIIVGAGPAGMTAALNALRADKKVLILEANGIGGQISLSPKVENFPTVKQSAGSELMDKLFEQISDWGVEFEFGQVVNAEKTKNGFLVQTDYDKYEAKSLIIATGVNHRPIGVDREEELVGHGVSYCALCDGAFFAGEDVAVIGDANTALQYALLLTNYCSKVHICTLFDKFFADKPLVSAVLKKQNVAVYHNLNLKEFVGSPELSGLKFENTKDKSEFSLNVKGAFVCIGQIPSNKAFEKLVSIDKNGYVISDETCKTSMDGIFVAGDCRTKEIRQLVTATADGSVAAFHACQYLDSLN